MRVIRNLVNLAEPRGSASGLSNLAFLILRPGLYSSSGSSGDPGQWPPPCPALPPSSHARLRLREIIVSPGRLTITPANCGHCRHSKHSPTLPTPQSFITVNERGSGRVGGIPDRTAVQDSAGLSCSQSRLWWRFVRSYPGPGPGRLFLCNGCEARLTPPHSPSPPHFPNASTQDNQIQL